MKILVTGGTGFIGSHLLMHLSGTQHQIRCLVRPTSDTTVARRVGAELVVGDVTRSESVIKSVSGCDAVLHLANLYEFWIPRRKDYYSVNVVGTRNVMEAALETGVQKVVHVSSLVTYGTPEEKPVTEESAPGQVRYSQYAETKYEGDLEAWRLYHEQKLPLVVVYPGAVIGPGDDKPSGRYIENIVRQRMPAQVLVDSVLTWVDVKDVARVIVAALEKEGNLGERYFAAAERLTIGEFNRLVSRIAGVRLPRLIMPAWMVFANAAVLTSLARVFKFSPMLGMSLDQIRTMRKGFSADGSKVTRDLGIQYTPISTSIKQMVAEIRA